MSKKAEIYVLKTIVSHTTVDYFSKQKHAYPNQRNSDGETEPNQVAITTASSPTSPNNQAASYTTPAVLSATGQNVTNRLYPKVPQSTEITTNTGNIVSATMRSQTSLSTSSSGHSPTRVSGSKSVPNMPLKKPFYAGGNYSRSTFKSILQWLNSSIACVVEHQASYQRFCIHYFPLGLGIMIQILKFKSIINCNDSSRESTEMIPPFQ